MTGLCDTGPFKRTVNVVALLVIVTALCINEVLTSTMSLQQRLEHCVM